MFAELRELLRSEAIRRHQLWSKAKQFVGISCGQMRSNPCIIIVVKSEVIRRHQLWVKGKNLLDSYRHALFLQIRLHFPDLLYDIRFLIYNNYDDVVEGKRYFGPN